MKNIKTIYLLVILCFLFESLGAQSFKFAQLTDLHLSSHNNAPREDLECSIKEINQSSDLDFVLVTGDLTEEGDYKSLLCVKKILNQLTIPYYVIPGNHETKWSESGVTDFGRIFGSERFAFEHKGFLFLGFNSGPLLRMALGHVVPQDINWIEQEIKKNGKNQPVILVTHYPLKKGDVDNWYEVTDAVRKYNIKLVIGGHYHRNIIQSYDGIPGVLSRSNLKDKNNKVGYSIFEVTPDSIKIYEQAVNLPKQQWAGVALTHQYYDRKGKAKEYPDFSINEEYNNVEVLWSKKTGVGIYSSPAIDNANAYIGDDLGYVSCYNLSTGDRLWRFKTNARIVGTPDVKNNILVVASADQSIYGINALTGKKIWQMKTNKPILGAVKIKENIAYVGGSDHTMRAINIFSGKVIWSYKGVEGYIETRPLVTSQKVIFGAWDNTLYALNKNQGTVAWKWTGGLTRMHFSPAAVWPVESDNKVFIVDPERALTAINLENGETIWRTYESKVRESLGISEDKERLFAKTMQDSIVCFSTKSIHPQKVWATNLDFGYEHASSMLIEKGGKVYGSTKEGVIFALDSKNGEIIWKHKIGNSLINTVIPINNKSIIATSTDGSITVLKEKTNNYGKKN